MCHTKPVLIILNTKLGRILNVPYKTTVLMILVTSVDPAIKKSKTNVEVK
jgi:hypothetical protein